MDPDIFLEQNGKEMMLSDIDKGTIVAVREGNCLYFFPFGGVDEAGKIEYPSSYGVLGNSGDMKSFKAYSGDDRCFLDWRSLAMKAEDSGRLYEITGEFARCIESKLSAQKHI